jgi:hypothetical protein
MERKPGNVPLEPAGWLTKTGIVESYNADSKQLTVVVENAVNPLTRSMSKQKVVVDFATLAFSNGIFCGGIPSVGTKVSLTVGDGGQYYLENYIPTGSAFQKYVDLKDGEFGISSSRNSFAKFSTDGKIKIGSKDFGDQFYTPGRLLQNYKSEDYDSKYTFTQAAIKVDGVIRRETSKGTSVDSDRIYDDDYYQTLRTVNLDPSSSANMFYGRSRNPPLAENREVVYEFAFSSKVERDTVEEKLYGVSSQKPEDKKYQDRRNSRANTLNLSLYNPNALIETVKGTVADIYGNILGINREILPVGNDDLSLNSSDDAYKRLRTVERKSIAYHWELNARKDRDNQPDILSGNDYSRGRSRLFVDVDKEGLVKVNIPASSEVGNVPLLTRYENYSIFSGKDPDNLDLTSVDESEPNKMLYRKDRIDIIHDSFAAKQSKRKENNDNTPGVIKIVDSGNEATPKDRLTNKHIRYGTAYHDITDTCYTFLQKRTNAFSSFGPLDYQIRKKIVISNTPTDTLSRINIAPLKKIIEDKINVGDDANAGGRSIDANIDGSVTMSVGANTSDRQSLVADFAGGAMLNVGRDKRDISLAMHLDGHLIAQVGGATVDNDSRFKDSNGHIGGVVDLRIISDGGLATIIRVDASGTVSLIAPGAININSNKSIDISTSGAFNVTAREIGLNGRRLGGGTKSI